MRDMIFVQDRSKKYPYVKDPGEKEPRVSSEGKTLSDFIKDKKNGGDMNGKSSKSREKNTGRAMG